LGAGSAKHLPPDHNSILAALPLAEYEALVPELEWVHVPNGRYLDKVGGSIEHAYFPTEGIASLVYESAAGEYCELALVGCEGMTSVTSFMADRAARHRALVRSPLSAYRLPARRLKAKFHEGGALQRLLLSYTECVILHISLTAVCNRHHTLEKQLCRWLLQSLDRVGGVELCVTQELIASLLGVRRQGVNEAVCRLQDRGLISWARGVITVTDHAGLVAEACECYDVLRKDTERLMSPRLAQNSRQVLAEGGAARRFRAATQAR
jgi:CRP-like cAMP-binding protein